MAWSMAWSIWHHNQNQNKNKQSSGSGNHRPTASGNVGSWTGIFLKFTQLRGLVEEEEQVRENLRKAVEDELQVYSVKKTCGSEFEDVQKAAWSVPLQLWLWMHCHYFGWPLFTSTEFILLQTGYRLYDLFVRVSKPKTIHDELTHVRWILVATVYLTWPLKVYKQQVWSFWDINKNPSFMDQIQMTRTI